MSANILQSYLIKLGVSVERKEFDGFMSSVASGVSTLAKVGAVAVGAFGALQAGVMKLASSESALKELAERAGTTVQHLERMGYVASQSGSSTASMQQAFETLAKKAGQAATGLQGAQRVFTDLGISVYDSNGRMKDSATLMDNVGRALSRLDHNSQLGALDRLGLDRSLFKTLTTDISDLKAEFDEMAEIAGVDFSKTAKAASELTDEVGKTTTFMRLSIKVLGADLMGDTAIWLRGLRKKFKENAGTIQQVIRTTVKVIQTGGIIVGGVLMRLGQAFAWLHEKTDGLSTVVIALGAAVGLLGWPVAAAAALIAGLYLVIDDMWTALEDGETLLDWSPWLDDIRAAGKWLEKVGETIKQEFNASLRDLLKWLDRIARSLGFKNLDAAIKAVTRSIPGIIRESAKLIAYFGGKAWAVVKGAFGFVGEAIEAVIKILGELSKFVVNVLTGDFESAFGNIKGVVKAFDEFMDSTFGRIKNLITGVIQVIIDAIDKTKELLGLGTKSTESKPKERKNVKKNDKIGDPGGDGVVEAIGNATKGALIATCNALDALGNSIFGLLGAGSHVPANLNAGILKVPVGNPAQAQMAAANSAGATVEQNNEININNYGKADPERIATQTGESINRVNATVARYSPGKMK